MQDAISILLELCNELCGSSSGMSEEALHAVDASSSLGIGLYLSHWIIMPGGGSGALCRDFKRPNISLEHGIDQNESGNNFLGDFSLPV